jgi:hypothetical protein
MTTLAFFLIGYLVAVLNSLLLDWLKRRRDGYIQIEAKRAGDVAIVRMACRNVGDEQREAIKQGLKVMLETQDGSSVPSIVRFEEMEFKEEGKV